MPISRLTLALVVLAAFATGTVGCAPSVTIRAPTVAEIDRVRSDELAVVLFQVTVSIDGQPVALLGPGDSNNRARIYLARLDDHAAPQRVTPAALSEQAAVQNWYYLMLQPGVYYLLLLPPGVEQNPPAVAYAAGSGRYGRLTQYRFEPGRGGFWAPELMAFVFAAVPPPDFRELQGFWFEVPESRAVVYLGSLSIRCTGGRGLFGSLIDSCEDVQFHNDIQAAGQVAAASLSGLTVHARPLVEYGQARQGTSLHGLGPVDVVTHVKADMGAVFTGAEIGSYGVIPGSGRIISGYNLLTIGIELAGRAMAEKQAAVHGVAIRPCIDSLSEVAGAMDYSAMFLSALGASARSLGVSLEFTESGVTAGPVQSSPTLYRLKTSVPLLRLREAETPQHLALELALEVRLEAVENNALLYYGRLYYAPELPLHNPLVPQSPLYARFVSPGANSRLESDWCGAGGPALLAE